MTRVTREICDIEEICLICDIALVYTRVTYICQICIHDLCYAWVMRHGRNMSYMRHCSRRYEKYICQICIHNSYVCVTRVCCIVLQCVAVGCSWLQCVVGCCSVLQCVAIPRWQTHQSPPTPTPWYHRDSSHKICHICDICDIEEICLICDISLAYTRVTCVTYIPMTRVKKYLHICDICDIEEICFICDIALVYTRNTYVKYVSKSRVTHTYELYHI